MLSYTPSILSGSTNGDVIPIAATATPGTLIHTAIAGGSGFDEVFFWVANVTGSAATLTVEWGGVSDPADLATKTLSIPPNGPPVPIMVGQRINGGLAVRAFSNTSNALNVTGYTNRIQ